jgi:hypothetical protein
MSQQRLRKSMGWKKIDIRKGSERIFSGILNLRKHILKCISEIINSY